MRLQNAFKLYHYQVDGFTMLEAKENETAALRFLHKYFNKFYDKESWLGQKFLGSIREIPEKS